MNIVTEWRGGKKIKYAEHVHTHFAAQHFALSQSHSINTIYERAWFDELTCTWTSSVSGRSATIRIDSAIFCAECEWIELPDCRSLIIEIIISSMWRSHSPSISLWTNEWIQLWLLPLLLSFFCRCSAYILYILIKKINSILMCRHLQHWRTRKII